MGLNRSRLCYSTDMSKLWVDDIRPAPEGWIHVHTVQQAVLLLGTGDVAELSLDHDLGDDAGGTGHDIALWIEEAVATKGFKPPHIAVHSQNPVGRKNIVATARSIKRLHAKNETTTEEV